MIYPAFEKLEFIRNVETSHLPVRRTLDKIGIPSTTFYAWLDRYAAALLEVQEQRGRWGKVASILNERGVRSFNGRI
jgi:putative transposase